MTAPTIQAPTKERARTDGRIAIEPVSGPGPLPLADLTTIRSEAQAALAEGWTPIEAARLVLARMAPDENAAARLFEVGIAVMVNRDLGTRRDGQQPTRPPAVVALLPADAPGEDPLHVPAQKADGTMAPLSTWRVEDWRAWTVYCEAQAEGWFRRQEGSREIADLLTRQKAGTVAELPAAGQEKARQIIRGFRA